VVESGQSVIVVEDLISTGGSSLRAVEALKAAGANVKGLVAIFSYGFEIAEKRFKDAKCMYYTLSDYHYLLNQAITDDYIREDDLKKLKDWREDPENWGSK
jgi:orotate phosphoribosyltransferase